MYIEFPKINYADNNKSGMFTMESNYGNLNKRKLDCFHVDFVTEHEELILNMEFSIEQTIAMSNFLDRFIEKFKEDNDNKED